MRNKKTKYGECKLCRESKELTFEHIPPRSAYNKDRKYSIVKSGDLYQNFYKYNSKKLKPKSRIEQGGIGEHCLCEECNNFLGTNYVREYTHFAKIAKSIIYNNPKDVKCYEFDISDINALKFIKQVISIFICSNDSIFTEIHPELLEFVTKPKSNNLHERYRVYMYLNSEGPNRNGNFSITNTHGKVCDFAYSPFGFVLSIDNPNQIMEVSEITEFKNYDESIKSTKVRVRLNKYPTFSPFPLDFRDEKSISSDIAKALKHMNDD